MAKKLDSKYAKLGDLNRQVGNPQAPGQKPELNGQISVNAKIF